jgi:hypothetical protein
LKELDSKRCRRIAEKVIHRFVREKRIELEITDMLTKEDVSFRVDLRQLLEKKDYSTFERDNRYFVSKHPPVVMKKCSWWKIFWRKF